MKEKKPAATLKVLCELFGKKRQSFYEKKEVDSKKKLLEEKVIAFVKEQRSVMSFLGGRKLLSLLDADAEFIKLKVRRDKLFTILRKHNLLIRKRKRYVITTDSKHWMRKYPNLIADLIIDYVDQVWVSDITFIRIKEKFNYLFLITDVYSCRIMGYALKTTMDAEGGIEALRMALEARKNPLQPLIHHSDRGSQYCCNEYVNLLKANNIQISMTENGDPHENPKAERMNGILKDEFQIEDSFSTHEEAVEKVSLVVNIYNNLRPHLSCDYLTPDKAYKSTDPLKKRWKNYRKTNKIPVKESAV